MKGPANPPAAEPEDDEEQELEDEVPEPNFKFLAPRDPSKDGPLSPDDYLSVDDMEFDWGDS